MKPHRYDLATAQYLTRAKAQEIFGREAVNAAIRNGEYIHRKDLGGWASKHGKGNYVNYWGYVFF